MMTMAMAMAMAMAKVLESGFHHSMGLMSLSIPSKLLLLLILMMNVHFLSTNSTSHEVRQVQSPSLNTNLPSEKC
jgi:hypothetical protein